MDEELVSIFHDLYPDVPIEKIPADKKDSIQMSYNFYQRKGTPTLARMLIMNTFLDKPFDPILEERLKKYNFTKIDVPGDGSCQFAAIGAQISDKLIPSCMRKDCSEYILENKDEYIPFLNIPIEKYATNLNESSFYGDQVSLQVMCDLYSLKIKIITGFETDDIITMMPRLSTPGKTIWLAFSPKNHHYDIIVPTKSTPTSILE